jgi:hypothetical protein
MLRNTASILIDETHTIAICMEVGERLQSELKECGPMPLKLAMLFARLSELDYQLSPSIVPRMENENFKLASGRRGPLILISVLCTIALATLPEWISPHSFV